MEKGTFITFEGCEGVGKSTQARKLMAYLEENGYDPLFTREPGGTPIAERIRQIILDPELDVKPLTEAYLFVTARNDHIENIISPALEKGRFVLCDRFVDSSIAYQGFARGLGMDEVTKLNSFAMENCLPDCTVFIDMDPAKSWRRQKGKVVENDRLEQENLDFHRKCYEGFRMLAAKYPERFLSIVPEVDKEATFNKIIEGLKERGIIKA